MRCFSLASMRYWWLVLPALLGLAVFYFYPIGRVFWMSITIPDLGISNYEFMMQSPSIRRMLWTTVRITILSTLITLILAYSVAYVIANSEARKRRYLFIGVVISLWISVLVRAFAWFILLRNEGLINQLLMFLRIIDTPLPLMWNEFSVLVGMVHYMLPLAILPLYAGMYAIDHRFVAAARGLGANRLTAFWKIYFPLTKPAIFAACLLIFIYALGFYVTPALLGGGKTMMIAEYIKVQILDVVNWGIGSALAALLLVFIVMTLVLVGRIVDMRKAFGAG